MKYFFLLISLTILLCSGCANQGALQGGPPDLTPPNVESTYPDNGAVYFDDDKIKIEFDKYVDQAKASESVFISPHIKNLEYDWSGAQLTIRLDEPLHRNTTYVINIGTDVVDLHNRNRMAHAYTMAFSTGASIEKGVLRGRVFPMSFGQQVSGIMIYAYRLDSLNADTLNPKTQQPDYITQTGMYGDFSLTHIPFGTYRILAVKDQYRNYLYDPESDQFGLLTGDIVLTATDTLRDGLLMKLSVEDTTSPRLLKITAINNRHLETEFSEPILPSGITKTNFSIVDTATHNELPVVDLWAEYKKPNTVEMITALQDSNAVYRLTVSQVQDSVGNSINPTAKSLSFTGSAKRDTMAFRLVSVSLRDSVRGVEVQPSILFQFSDATASGCSLDSIELFSKNHEPVEIIKQIVNNTIISIQPKKTLKNMEWYTLRAALRTIRNWNNDVCKDSTKLWRFQTLDVEDLSSIEGAITDLHTTDREGTLYVTAMMIDTKSSISYTVPADATGHFQIQPIKDGKYVLQVFRDRNNNGKFDAGRPYPFLPSERISGLSDTLKVRARWPLENVQLTIP